MLSFIKFSLRYSLVSLSLLAFAVPFARADGDSLDKGMATLKEKLSKQLIAKGRKKVAALDFVDLQGRHNELGRFLAEDLTVELVGSDGLSVVDRANLKSILDEHKLTEEGLVNPDNAKKLGQFSGVDVILLGTVTASDSDITLLVKAVSTDTAEVVAAGRATFKITPQYQQMISAGIFPEGTKAALHSDIGKPTSIDIDVIASKDLGPLKVALRNVVPIRARTNDGKALVMGSVCTFDFVNTDLTHTIKVAVNASRNRNDVGYIRRSKITDSNGHGWGLFDTSGLPIVAVSYNGDPSSIVKTIQTGHYTDSGDLSSQYSNPDFWGGDFETIEPGKSVRVSMSFMDMQGSNRTNRGTIPFDFFQMESELVLENVDPKGNISHYSLESLVFDKIVMPREREAAAPEHP